MKKTYTVTDAEGDTITVVEKLDGSVIRTLNNQASGTSLTVDLTTQWPSLSLASHTITIGVTDSKGLAGATRTWTFTKTNSAPRAPIIISPVNLTRVDTAGFDAAFTVSTDAEGDAQTLCVQLADDSAFTTGVRTITSGLKRYNSSTKVWDDVSNATNSDSGKSFKFNITGLTVNTTKYIRVGSIDTAGSNTTSWSAAIQIKVGNKLEFTTLPSALDFMPTRLNVIDKKTVDSKATIKVFACNNALDVAPTWENITTQYNYNEAYVFTNTTKTGNQWAVAVKYQISANDAAGEISVDAIGVGVS
ncbi:hypothetical protein [Clostridium sp. JN-9]|uniref:hypothetical protein n=1 Tax=Clostridium sp. JN-9 TaxID=2507159 RepID=UPI000FFDFB34|nr:hypothetical protein [Clostridium sp. JN-9]QAT40820.1 hypothetical protein EQM05_11420 [Clostridium sp. JN-9]